MDLHKEATIDTLGSCGTFTDALKTFATEGDVGTDEEEMRTAKDVKRQLPSLLGNGACFHSASHKLLLPLAQKAVPRGNGKRNVLAAISASQKNATPATKCVPRKRIIVIVGQTKRKKPTIAPKFHLALPDDSNYNRIVSFVQDIKTTIKVPARGNETCRANKSAVPEEPLSCRNAKYAIRRAIRIAVKPCAVSRQYGASLVNCWTRPDLSREEDDLLDMSVARRRLHVGKDEELSLVSQMRLADRTNSELGLRMAAFDIMHDDSALVPGLLC